MDVLHGLKFWKFLTTENDTMAVGDGENASGKDQVGNNETNAGSASLEEQRDCLKSLLLTPLSKGETWYLVDSKWFKQWKKYVGYDSWVVYKAGMESMNPGPVDNSGLFTDNECVRLKRHLIDELDYTLLPTKAWEKLAAWYGVCEGQSAIARQVIEHGIFVKHCMVEVYLVELKLCHNNDMETYQIRPFSRADNIGHVETIMRRLFEIAEGKETRIWNKYMEDKYQLLPNKEQTIQDCGLYNGQVVVLEEKDDYFGGTREFPKGLANLSSSEIDEKPITPGSSEYGTCQGTTRDTVSCVQTKKVKSCEAVKSKRGGDREKRVLGADGNVWQLKQEIEKMNVNYRALEKINQQFQKDKSDLRKNVNDLTYENDALTAKIQLQEQQIQKRREEKSEMENHNQQLRLVKRQVESENQQLREENTKSIDEIRQLRQAKGQMENQIQQLQHEKSDTENENQRIRREKSHLENENQQLRQETDDIMNEMQEIRQEKNNMEIEIQQYRENAMSSIFAESGSVVVSNEELGRGAWGAVYRGDFYGTKVAVKEFHQIILSPHNAGILDREIEIASQCRHPNLLQFICSTENDQHHLLIVTELMDMTLRTLLERRAREKLQLKYQEVKSISLDVARGLNYLHSKTPNPIIHRDVSSANVLLWIENGAVRRAKISDYGSANFMKVSKTKNPGSPLYAAPEASQEKQDPKIDVFSYGFLVCEMSVCELPYPEQIKRKGQIKRIQNVGIKRLVERCTEIEPQQRPTMQDVIVSW